MNATIVKLSSTKKYKKFQLASALGYNATEVNERGRCIVHNLDICADNDFRNIDEFLLLIRNDLYKFGFAVVA